jgi:hypothetical protein
MRFGFILAGVALAIELALVFTGVSRGWRFVLVPLLFVAAVGYFQAREKT